MGLERRLHNPAKEGEKLHGLEIEVRVMPAATSPSETPEPAAAVGVDITSLPFFGMWADRKDMRDSAKWVRKEREKWSSRLTGTDS